MLWVCGSAAGTRAVWRPCSELPQCLLCSDAGACLLQSIDRWRSCRDGFHAASLLDSAVTSEGAG
eukprot:12428015-Alexandrium_andersonii.AAC.1